MINKPLFNLNDFFGLEIQNPSMFVTTNKLESKNSCIQTHSNNVKYIDKPGTYKNVDGLVTNLENKIKLVIQTADCVPIFITDLKKECWFNTLWLERYSKQYYYFSYFCFY